MTLTTRLGKHKRAKMTFASPSPSPSPSVSTLSLACQSPPPSDVLEEPQPDRGLSASSRDLLTVFTGLSDGDKRLLLKQMASHASPEVLSPLYISLTERLRCDVLGSLPLEIAIQVLGHLDLSSLLSCMRVSKTWKYITLEDPILWHKLYKKEVHASEPEDIDLELEHVTTADSLSAEQAAELVDSDQMELEDLNPTHQSLSGKTPYGARGKVHGVHAPTPSESPSISSESLHALDNLVPVQRITLAPSSDACMQRSSSEGATSRTFVDALPRSHTPHPRPKHVKLFSARTYLHQIKQFKSNAYLWRHGVPKTLSWPCHPNHVVTCLQMLSPARIISGSDDGTIRIWCSHTGRELQRFTGHTGGVWALHAMDKYLLSGSTDRTLRFWKLSSGECLGTLKGHSSTVRCISLFHLSAEYLSAEITRSSPGAAPDLSQLLPSPSVSSSSSASFPPASHTILPDGVFPCAVSGSRDLTLRIWDLKNMTTKHVLSGHTGAIRCLIIHGRLLISGSYDNSTRVWDLATGTQLHVLLGHSSKIYALAAQGPCLATGGLDASIFLWNLGTGKLVQQLEGHRNLVGSLQFSRPGLLVSGNTDGTMRIWDLEKGETRFRLRPDEQGNGAGGPSEPAAITCLQVDHHRLVSGSDKCLKLWDPTTGAFIRDLVTGVDTVWRTVYDENVVVAAAQSQGVTSIHVVRFEQLKP